ncbi:MAG: nickel pincer cofactor biosynthesis protein LarB [Oscillospiraceae bacterium]|nr:nickel pincer cofactor biosynthesis protein LarB [Oscillospiraceae bacterium]
MDQTELLHLLSRVQRGESTPEEAAERLRAAPFEDLGYARVDRHRGIRQGVPEVIFGAGKSADQIAGILAALDDPNVLVTRLSPEKAAALAKTIPLCYHEIARLAVARPRPTEHPAGSVVVVSAGTSDMSVAEEAALTAETLGCRVTRLYDAGVAGIHRLLSSMETLQSARVVVAVAGMEGALPSVVAGLVGCPVLAVPTSVGYGASFGGVAALLGMLNSCASGLSVLNIDNGFGAGYQASLINHLGEHT